MFQDDKTIKVESPKNDIKGGKEQLKKAAKQNITEKAETKLNKAGDTAHIE